MALKPFLLLGDPGVVFESSANLKSSCRDSLEYVPPPSSLASVFYQYPGSQCPSNVPIKVTFVRQRQCLELAVTRGLTTSLGDGHSGEQASGVSV